MDTDIFLVVGIVLAVFSVPSILSTISEGRRPRIAIYTIIFAVALIVYAIKTHPGGYTLYDVPEAFVRVVAMII